MTKKRILLGIDAASLPMTMDFFSNREKFSVTIVHDGNAALQCIIEEKPDLAVLDVNLPKKGGDDCCEAIKLANLAPATLIALMVWVHNSSDIKRCLEVNCDALLVKPLAYERLAGVITRLLFSEKSVTPRFLVRLPMRCGILHQDLADNYTVNLSTGGVFLEAQHVVPVGTPVKVIITLPDDGTTITCMGEVTWVNSPELRCQPLLPPGMGLKFLDIGNREVSAIQKFLYSEERVHWM
jgi:uncharacterized protein (TIGR02266 family)